MKGIHYQIRHFTLFCLTLLPYLAHSQPFNTPLFIPDTQTGPEYNLTIQPSTVQFLPGNATETYGISADYLAPTLIMRNGEEIRLNVTNDIDEETTMHWHGMHVSPEDDGGPHTIIYPGETWSPEFTVLDEATTFWYHPHLHEHTAQQVYNGAAGMIIVRDDHSESLSLPSTYGVDEFPLIIQDKSFDPATNQLIFLQLADTVMVNGTLSPYLEVPAQMVRIHVLNASNQRVYNLGFSQNMPVSFIGSDGGLLESPVPGNRFQLAPGERGELVIDFAGLMGQNIRLLAYNSEMGDGVSGGPKGPKGKPGNPLDGVDFEFMEFRVVQQTANPITSIPSTLNSFDIPSVNDVARTRVKTFTEVDSTGPYYIDGQTFNMMVVNDTVLLDDIEIWELRNETGVSHPFHIHDIQFFILDINGKQPPPNLRARKDVILSNPGDTIRFITQFTDFTDRAVPYMYHCHNLFHEDAGMMGQFSVFRPEWLQDDLNETDIVIWPNPFDSQLYISSKEPMTQILSMELFDARGNKAAEYELDHQRTRFQIDTEELLPGVYFARVLLEDESYQRLKLIKE